MIDSKTKPTILLVDDAKFNLELMVNLLDNTFEIMPANNGVEALDIMRANADRIDAVLLDMIMPGLNGCDVLEQINKDPALSDIPVIVLTSDDDPYTKLRAFDLGAMDFVQRGSDITVIKHRILNVIRLNKLERASAEKEDVKTALYNENRFTAFMDSIPGGVCVLRTDGKSIECSYFNSELLMLMGMTAEEFTTQFAMGFRPEWVKTFLAEGLESKHYTYTFAVGDQSDPNSCQWVRLISAKLGESDGVSDIFCIFLDVNDEKNHERLAREAGEKLRASEDRLRENEYALGTLMDNGPGGIIYAERDVYGKFRVKVVNKGMAEMLEYSNTDSLMEELAKDTSAGVSEIDVSAIRKKLDKSLESGVTLKHSFNCISKTGRLLWLMLTAKPVMKPDGTLCLFAFVTNITKEKQIEEELRITAYYDPLTNLFNRSAFLKSVRAVLDENPLSDYSLMILNISGFKTINDLFGRDAGDVVLKTVAATLRECLGTSGIIGRFFADRFCMMVPYSERAVHPQTVLEALQAASSKLPQISNELQYYLGVYRITDKSVAVGDMADRASIACRSITGSYSEHIAYYDEAMRLQLLEEQEIIDQSRKALRNKEFVLHYQPVYGMKKQKFVSAEALVRWNHPTKGMIMPNKFIPVFEKNGFIAELDLYVLEQVCIYQKKRIAQGLEPFPISVNISRMSLYNPRLYELISSLAERYGIDTNYVRVEITESAYNDNPTQLLDTVRRLRENNYLVLMDDFGSGYSSLNTLKDIPIDILKLDMKFMQGFETNDKVGTIVTAIARMSKWIDVPMLAEGVETREQYEFLLSIGCSYIQGYYFSKPIPEEEFTEVISREGEPEMLDVNPSEKLNIGEPNINEMLGSNLLVSKFFSSVFGGLGIYELINNRLELIRANDGYYNIMGHSEKESSDTGINAWEYVHPDDVKLSVDACMEAARTDKAVLARVRRYAKNGELLTLDGVHRRLGGTDENPIFCIAFSNVTETVKNDEIIKHTKDRTEQLLSATGSLLLDIDYANKSVFCTGSFGALGVEINSFSDVNKLEKYCIENVHPLDANILQNMCMDMTAPRVSGEVRIKNADGEYKWWRLTHVRSFDENGRLTRVVLIASFIEAEKFEKFRLEQAKVGLEAAVDRMGAGVVAVEMTENGIPRMLYSNDGFWNTLGRKRVPGDVFMTDIFKGRLAEKVYELAEHVKASEAHVVEHTFTRDDGTKGRIEIRAAMSEWENCTNDVFLFFITDISERHEHRQILSAIVETSNNGMAYVDTSEGGYTLKFANDRFRKLLCLEENDDKRLYNLLSDVIESKIEVRDIHIRRGSDARIVRTNTKPVGEHGWIISLTDVTTKRGELKDRINERMENAEAGLYDIVFNINLKSGMAKLLSTRKEFGVPFLGKSLPFAVMRDRLLANYIYPDDVERLEALLAMPFESPDFTDAYREIRFADTEASGKFILYGVTVVRSRSDACMVFCRDKSRVDRMVANSKVADLTRLYQLVAERAKITVIEWDHVTNRTICSPSIEEYWASKLSTGEFYETFREAYTVYDDDKQAFADLIDKVYSYNSGTETVRLKLKDGTFKWCRLSISLTRANDGSVMRSLCIIEQLDREEAEDSRHEKGMQLLQRTVSNIPVGIGIFRMENTKPAPVYISDSVYEIFGINGRNMDIPVLPAESLAKQELTKGAQGRITLESMKADGTDFELAVKYRVAVEGEDTLLYAAFSDVTGEAEARRRKATEFEMYSMLLCETGTIIFTYSPERDEMTYLDYTDEARQGEMTTVLNLHENTHRLTRLDPADRARLLDGIETMKNGRKSYEMQVRINIDGYPRRFNISMRAVADSDNSELFMIIGKMEDVEDELTHIERIEAKAKYDTLCVGIYNKATTEELIRAELERGTGGILMMLDIDDFKSINDTLGHLFGDEFLKRFSGVIKGEFRNTDIVGRYGGDEFIVFLPKATASLARKKGWHILETVAAIDVPQLGSVKSSIGAAVVNPATVDYAEAIRQADAALYQAKNAGKNCLVVFDGATMDEDSYRIRNDNDSRKHEAHGTPVEFSANPSGASSLMMRVFSALYSSADIDAGISQILELVGRTYDVSRVYIFEDSEDGKLCNNTFEWCNEGIAPCIEQLQNVSYDEDLCGEFLSCFNDDGIVYCQDIDDLPPAVMSYLNEQGIKSVLHCAIKDGNRFKGFVGFDECRSCRFWTQEQIDSLVFISKVISVFLLKGRSDQKERLT